MAHITDGKRSVSVRQGSDGVDVAVCRNGFQSVIVTMDEKMLVWLRKCSDEYLRQRQIERGDELQTGESNGI